jgi:autotransporter-associated beta strand protein
LTVANNSSLTAGTMGFGGATSSRIPGGSSVTVTNNGTISVSGSFNLDNNAGGTLQTTLVNLNGGSLAVSNFLDSVTGSGHLQQINFNGGTLKANANDPVGNSFLPAFSGLTVYVNGGAGALINPNGYSITVSNAIVHGSGTPDGGLTLNGSGTLTLAGANTYNGPTAVSNGTLVVIGSISTNTVTVTNATLSGTGTIGGATTMQPFAVLASGNGGVGTLTLSSNLTLNALSTNAFAVTPAGGVSNSVALGGTLTANNSVIKVTSGAALQPNNSYTLFNYSPSKPVSGSFNPVPVFDVAPAQRAYITNNATLGQINLVVVPTTTPAGTTFTMNVTLNVPSTVQIIGGKNAATDANGDPLTITAVTQGANGTVTFTPTNITYTATNTSATTDSFTYTVSDAYGNSSAPATVNVVIDNSVQGQTGYNQVGAQMINSQEVLSYAGIPGYNYALDETHSMTPPISWTAVMTNVVSANGSLMFTNTPSGGSDYYRTRYVP